MREVKLSSEGITVGPRQLPSTDWGSGSTLPPPRWEASRCAAGSGGQVGCRACVEACPYEAMRPLDMPTGTVIYIDPAACQRCGTCTGVCPTSALERAFLPDADLYEQIRDTLDATPPNTVLVLSCDASREWLASVASPRPTKHLVLPSLTILNENHLLQALASGAAGVAIVGCPTCHHGSPGVLAPSIEIARAIRGDPHSLIYVEQDGTDGARASFEHFLEHAPDALPSAPSLTNFGGSRREVFAELTARSPWHGDGGFVSQAAFGTVEVDEPNCTLCGACSRACPTNALTYSATDGYLHFSPVDCVGCGLCSTACPERVLTLTPGLDATKGGFENRTLVTDRVVNCLGCGDPYLPERLLEHVRKVVRTTSGHLPKATEEIAYCPSCRPVHYEDTAGLSMTRAHREHAAQTSAAQTSNALDAESLQALPVVPSPGAESSSGGCGGNCTCGGGAKPQPSERRSFLKGAATSVVTAVTALFSQHADAQLRTRPTKLTKRLGMVIDLNRCVGCHACTAVCKAENDVPLGVYRDWVEEHVLGEYPYARPHFLPKLCNQCDDPGCLRSCPTGAIFMRTDGIVDLNHDLCIACRACNQGCPYGMTFMDPVRGTADKCNFCAHRVDEGLEPACVDICPTNCRIFGDLDDPESNVSIALREQNQQDQVLRRELGLGPNVSYFGLPAELDR
ncbi:MAG: 4Fe-4S dicluster domain-containing protein [Trueperaceae bacterium]|nr:4Fe-4S dicluster domain-containing protein [Trueperaceae bacterium]